MNLKQVELIKNVSIPAAAQPEEKKKKSWEYTVMAEYNSDSKDKSADENKSQSQIQAVHSQNRGMSYEKEI